MLSIEEILTRGVTNILIKENLEKRLVSGEKLRIKLGIDPTGKKLHIGRAIPLWKLRNFQDHGHQIVLLIGDFTALIGDASDKTAERQMLTRKDVEENMKDYVRQMGMILDMDKVELVYNSDWLKKLDFNDVAKLAQSFSVAGMLDRDNFSKRYKEGVRIGLQEFLYPLMQGYDSVAIKADLELGGNDQYFNLLAGRTLQKAFDQKPQDIMTFELINGLDGRKMSTSYGNIISIIDEPKDQFGKIMSMQDDLIIKYMELCTQMPTKEIEEVAKTLKQGGNPRDAKMLLGVEIVKLYHGEEKAQEARQAFIDQFSKGNIPDDIPEFSCSKNVIGIIDLIHEAKLEPSRSQIRRLIDQGGVKIDGEKVLSNDMEVKLVDGMIVQVGKRRFVKVKM